MLARITAALCLAVFLSCGARAAPTETLVDCATFRSGWGAAIRALDPGHGPIGYEPSGDRRRGGDRVSGLVDAEGRLTCQEGKFTRLEVRSAAGSGDEFAMLVAAVLISLDGAISPQDARRLAEAMRAEARPGRDAQSSWGPYELSSGRTRDGREEFVADHAEN